jgi:ribosomal protein S18 acetylase RimI-like enzyme
MHSYRQATLSDFELTFHIKSGSIKPYVEAIWGWDEQVQLSFHTREFDPKTTQIILDDNRVIGLLSTTENADSIYVKSILIHHSAQKNGVGTAIMTDIIQRAQVAGKRVELQVYKVNQRAKKFYERLGFGVTGQTDLHYQMAYS